MRFEFRPLTRADVPMLDEWLHRPHVAQWWDGESSLASVEANYIDSDARTFLAFLDGEPAAYIQSYDTAENGVIGIDQFLASATDTGRGLGTALVTQFVEFLFSDSTVRAVIVDPDPKNARAIRCYEKAGFRFVGMKDSAYLMRRER